VRKIGLTAVALAALLAGGAVRIVQDQCGPFADVSPAFCPYILELYYLGITAGTSATTFSPDDPLTRGQGAVFVAKGLNQALARSSRRAALGQWWTTTTFASGLGLTNLGDQPFLNVSDGVDVWVGNQSSISRVRASDGRLLETWTGAVNAFGIVSAMGRIFVARQTATGDLSMIDPATPPGDVVSVATDLGPLVAGLAFDGSRFWVAHIGGSISIVTPAPTTPWPVTHVTTGFLSPEGILFDGSHIWVTDSSNQEPAPGRLLQLDSDGNIVLAITVGDGPRFPAFDGANIWVPNAFSTSVSVVQASTGSVVATLTGNGLVAPWAAAFDGTRILVTDISPTPGIAIWRAADLAPMGFVPTPSFAFGVCSDGINSWISLTGTWQLARF
jgi:hypothetical protein